MSIFYYYGLLQEKEDQLRRLKNGKSDLQAIKHEMTSYSDNVVKPDLSASTWHGTLAVEFENIRTKGAFQQYQDIEIKQLPNRLSEISEKINSLQSEMSSIRHTIHELEEEREKEMRRRQEKN
ncbi:DUF5082 domain-containing protein [Niallia circulans]|uniref:DUF5082 domain-containing protein n=1 Tax=Niallia circulans TaxID=1397 RepID=A0A0J1ILF9_NIACI|nr:DUF5082 family protein [Niallia circulans]KLV26718.1 hypothetical protein ABW02_09215 [Niallia circulans]MDR4317066.1 DUF5082 domain-containing protein [Niallia circulans]MED3838046.1 DUF5082 family protein [Niallia circulans]MED4241624.1 DUF5082 family protein [Niallia circulans]MED4247256.1 DUF5082 family protein [Niallia circulans]